MQVFITGHNQLEKQLTLELDISEAAGDDKISGNDIYSVSGSDLCLFE